MVAKVHDVPLDHALYDQNWVFNLVKTLHAWLQLWFIFMFPPLLWDLVIEAVMIDYGVLWDQCYPRYNQWAVMTILCQYSSERELLLRNVFQDWIVDDGNNYYTTCGNPHMAIMTPSDESLSKPFGRVFSPINSAGQWVFLLMRRKSSWALKINLLRNDAMSSETKQVPICFHLSDLKYLFVTLTQ